MHHLMLLKSKHGIGARHIQLRPAAEGLVLEGQLHNPSGKKKFSGKTLHSTPHVVASQTESDCTQASRRRGLAVYTRKERGARSMER